MKKGMTFLLCFIFVYSGIALADNDPMKGPWEYRDKEDVRRQDTKDSRNPGTVFVKLYRKYVSPIDGSDCPMYPSCSRYGMECLEKHGFFIGWTMIWDRLYRCGRDELKLSPWIILNGEPKCYDPVKHNNFWWSQK